MLFYFFVAFVLQFLIIKVSIKPDRTLSLLARIFVHFCQFEVKQYRLIFSVRSTTLKTVIVFNRKTTWLESFCRRRVFRLTSEFGLASRKIRGGNSRHFGRLIEDRDCDWVRTQANGGHRGRGPTECWKTKSKRTFEMKIWRNAIISQKSPRKCSAL